MGLEASSPEWIPVPFFDHRKRQSYASVLGGGHEITDERPAKKVHVDHRSPLRLLESSLQIQKQQEPALAPVVAALQQLFRLGATEGSNPNNPREWYPGDPPPKHDSYFHVLEYVYIQWLISPSYQQLPRDTISDLCPDEKGVHVVSDKFIRDLFEALDNLQPGQPSSGPEDGCA